MLSEHPGDVDRWIPNLYRPDTPPLEFDAFASESGAELSDLLFPSVLPPSDLQDEKLLDDPYFIPGLIWEQGFTPPASPPRSSSPATQSAVSSFSTLEHTTTTPYEIPIILPSTPAIYPTKSAATPAAPKRGPGRPSLKKNKSEANRSLTSGAGKSKVVKKKQPKSVAKAVAKVVSTVAASASRPVAVVVSSRRESECGRDSPGLRRKSHNVLERKRRSDLKNSYQVLREQIPDLRDNERTPTAQILGAAVRYIQQLQSVANESSSRLAALRATNRKLHASR